MAYAGQTIVNPVTHERITFLRTCRDGKGESVLFDCRVGPNGKALPPHVHRRQEERFEVISGTLGVMLGGKAHTLGPGERIDLPAGIKHQWWNAGDGEVYFRVEVVPPGNIEGVLETVCGLAQAGKLNSRVMPRNPFMLAQLGAFSEAYVPGVPIWMQRMGLAVGSFIGRLLGYDPTFVEYCDTQVAEPIIA